jgi:hypothetical protein
MPRSKTIKRYFCKECGVHVYMDGYHENEKGERSSFFLVNLRTIDQPQEGIDLSEVKIKYLDMLHDNFQAGKKDTPWSGGLP